jgi:hypothetical protein
MKTKVCAWCEQSPKQYPCKTARELNGRSMEKNEKGEYSTHLEECNVLVLDSCTKETKDKWNRLRA